jgi:hypothetical protein
MFNYRFFGHFPSSCLFVDGLLHLKTNRIMNNVQIVNNYINIPSLQAIRSYLRCVQLRRCLQEYIYYLLHACKNNSAEMFSLHVALTLSPHTHARTCTLLLIVKVQHKVTIQHY